MKMKEAVPTPQSLHNDKDYIGFIYHSDNDCLSSSGGESDSSLRFYGWKRRIAGYV